MGLLLFLTGLHKGKPVGGLQLIPLLQEQCSRAGETRVVPASLPFPSGHPSPELGAVRAQPWTLCEQEMCSGPAAGDGQTSKSHSRGLVWGGRCCWQELLLQSQLCPAMPAVRRGGSGSWAQAWLQGCSQGLCLLLGQISPQTCSVGHKGEKETLWGSWHSE